jgi:Na+/proline symporter
MDTQDTFKLVDYIIFLSMILVSAIIGFYFAWKDRKSYNINEYLLGNGKLKVCIWGIIIVFFHVIRLIYLF